MEDQRRAARRIDFTAGRVGLRVAPNDSAAPIQSFGSVELVVDSGGGGGALTCSVSDTKVFSRRPPPLFTNH